MTKPPTQTHKIIDGTAVSKRIRAEIKTRIDYHIARDRRPPCLAVLLVGDHPASQVYVASKERACAEVGITSKSFRLSDNVTQADLLRTIQMLNRNTEVDGILLQLPLPAGLSKFDCISAITPEKDVDGLTPASQGYLAWGLPGLYPCTPLGILELLKSTGIQLKGKLAAVIGRSILVGAPTANLLSHAGATVISIHSDTVEPQKLVRDADIVVVATGVKHLVGKAWIKPGAVVIDVGIHRDGGRITGDVNFDEVAPIASAITPVPKGVGPMTIAMLLSNCLKAYEIRLAEPT